VIAVCSDCLRIMERLTDKDSSNHVGQSSALGAEHPLCWLTMYGDVTIPGQSAKILASVRLRSIALRYYFRPRADYHHS
jgi:hypothetical protein